MTSDNVRCRAPWQRPDADVVAALARYPVANIGDASQRLDIVDGGIHPIWHGARAAGTALPVMTVAGDNLAVIEALEVIRPGDIMMVNAFGFAGRGVIGDNLAQRFEFHGASGAVVDGYVRDRDVIESLRFPVFARGLNPAGPFKHGPGTIGEPVAIGGVVVNAGDIVVADSDGIVVVRPERARDVLRAVEEIAVIEAEKDAEVATMRALRSSHTQLHTGSAVGR